MYQAVKMKSQGFTLLEVMIFTSILSIVLVSMAAFVTRLVYNLRINEHKVYANYYASEVQEWLSSEREDGWSDIYAKAGSGAGNTYCLNTNLSFKYVLNDLPTPPTACSSFDGIIGLSSPKIFKRELKLQQTTSSTVTATITVSWNEGSKLYQEQIQSNYTSY